MKPNQGDARRSGAASNHEQRSDDRARDWRTAALAVLGVPGGRSVSDLTLSQLMEVLHLAANGPSAMRAPATPSAGADDELLTLDQVAAELGYSVPTIRRRISDGLIAAVKLGRGGRGAIRVLRSELRRYLAACRAG